MNRKCVSLIAAVVAIVVASPGSHAVAQSVGQQRQSTAGIEIVDAWIQAPPQGAPVAAGYMRIVNHGGSNDRLLAISSPRAGRVEMHEMSMEGAMMSMRPLRYGAAVPGNGAFEFSSVGAHIMFNNMNGSYAAGATIPLRLTFQHAGMIDIEVPVRAMGGGDARH